MHRRSTKTTFITSIIALVIGVMFASVLTSCSNSAAEAVEVTDKTIILDVRTPEEFAAGHLDGAQLLDFNGGQFTAALPNLDPDAEYIVYCRSGNRSGQAVAMMKQQGINNVTDLGPMENASAATGLDIVS